MIESVGAKVRADGTMLWRNEVFWSEASAGIAGSWVTLMIPPPNPDHLIVRLPSGDIRVDRVQDISLVDIAAAQALVDEVKRTPARRDELMPEFEARLRKLHIAKNARDRRIEGLRRIVRETMEAEMALTKVALEAIQGEQSSVVRREAAALLDLLDQRYKRREARIAPIEAAPHHHRIGHLARLLHDACVRLFKPRQRGQQQPAQGVDLDLEKLEAVFERLLGFGHSHSPLGEPENTGAPSPAHRLSETGK